MFINIILRILLDFLISHRFDNRVITLVLENLRKRILLDLSKTEVISHIAGLKRVRFTYQNEKAQKNWKRIFRASRVMFQTRGLTRCLMHNFLPRMEMEQLDFLTCSRFELVKFISTRPRIFYSDILQKISFTYEFAQLEYVMVEKEKFFDNKYSSPLIPNQVYEFALDWSNEKTHHNFFRRIHSAQNSFLSSLITWDLARTRQVVSLLAIEQQFYAFLNLCNPNLAKHMRRVRVLEIHHMKNSSQTFDTLMEQEKDHFIQIERLEIWHNRIFVQDSNLLVSDVTASPVQDFVSGLWQFAKPIKGTKSCDVLAPSMVQKTLESGIVIVGRVDTNWFHFLLDTLPRVLFTANVPEEVPLVVRGDVPQSGKKIIENITRREIIYLEDSDNVTLKIAYIMPARGAVFDSKPRKNIPRLEYSFKTYRMLVDAVKPKIASDVVENRNIPFAVLRRSSSRAITNYLEVAEVLGDFGVTILEADENFFSKQLEIFSEARHFIGAGGAVVSNIIFMGPSSSVVILENKSSTKLGIWKELALGMGLQYDSVNGKSVRLGSFFKDELHLDFEIDRDKLARVLEKNLRVD